jgi:hypothetical protein
LPRHRVRGGTALPAQRAGCKGEAPRHPVDAAPPSRHTAVTVVTAIAAVPSCAPPPDGALDACSCCCCPRLRPRAVPPSTSPSRAGRRACATCRAAASCAPSTCSASRRWPCHSTTTCDGSRRRSSICASATCDDWQPEFIERFTCSQRLAHRSLLGGELGVGGAHPAFDVALGSHAPSHVDMIFGSRLSNHAQW